MDENEKEFEGLRDALLADTPGGPDAQRVAELRARVASMRDVAAPTAPDVETLRTPAGAGAGAHGIFRWVLASAAAIVLVVAGVLVVDRATDTPRSDLAGGTVEFKGEIGSTEGLNGDLTVTMVETGRIVELQTDDLAILPKGEFYEVWFVGPGDRPEAPDRISAGTFHPDDAGRSDIVLTAAADPKLYPTIEVSAETGGDTPGELGPVVLTVAIGS